MKNIVVVVVAVLWSFSVNAQSIDKGQSICYEAQNLVNGLVDYTETSCLPSSGKKGALTFMFISSKPIFSVEASKKAWAIVTVAAIGKILNDQPSLKADEIWLSDLNQVQNKVAYTLPASLAKSLQKQVSTEKINFEQMYSSINKNMIKKTVTK